MKRSLIVLAAFAAVFAISFVFPPLIATGQLPFPGTMRMLCLYLPSLIPVGLCLWILKYGMERTGSPALFRDPLGVGLKGVPAGLLYALCAVLPMVVGYSVTGSLNRDFTADTFIRTVVIAGFFEELYFRGLLFGLLFRYCRWGFIPAVLLGALIFGALHLYQGETLAAALAVFGVTAAGAVLYSWIYAEWNYNLWTVIFLHMMMNAAWLVFTVSDNAAGSLRANIPRVATILLAVGITVWRKKRTGEGYRITARTLLVNRPKAGE